jgi:hypothetical protein
MTGSTLAARIFSIVMAAVTGAAVGFVLTFTHRQYVVELAGIPIPFGLIAGLAIVAALLAGMRLAFGERIAPIAAALGVILASAVLAFPGSSGSVLVFDDPLGYVWAIAPTVVAFVVIGWPERRRRTYPSSEGDLTSRPPRQFVG